MKWAGMFVGIFVTLLGAAMVICGGLLALLLIGVSHLVPSGGIPPTVSDEGLSALAVAVLGVPVGVYGVSIFRRARRALTSESAPVTPR